jgi:hypothetical protein
MRIIPTRVHGMLDYGTGLLLLISPYLFGFSDVGGAAQYIPMILGAGIIAASLITDYELSIARIIPMPMHLAGDIAGGVLLAASPWLFGFADRVYAPHLIIGLMEIAAGLMTRTTPDRAGYATPRT